jgi:hypothetical protein
MCARVAVGPGRRITRSPLVAAAIQSPTAVRRRRERAGFDFWPEGNRFPVKRTTTRGLEMYALVRMDRRL